MEKEAIKYVKDLRIPVSTKYLRKIILAHPDYPSIVSLADAFGSLGIDCAVARKPVDELADVGFPFLLHAEPNHIKYIRSQRDLDKAREQYYTFTGILIKIEQTRHITDPLHNKEFRRDRSLRSVVIGMITVFATLVLIPILSNLSIFSGLLMLTALAGIGLVVMLKIREYGLSWERLDAFCQTGPNTDCDSVITSAGGKFFGVFSLTNIALSYFTWQLVALAVVSVVPGSAVTTLSAVSLASTGSIAVVAYSILYQWRIVGKWCKFCLLMAGVCILQFGLVLAFNSDGLRFTLSSDITGFAGLLLLFLLLVSAFTIVSMIEEKEMALSESDIYQKRIYNSPRVFFGQLRNEPTTSSKRSETDITLGNPNSAVTLTVVFNLRCKPCKEAFDQLREFVLVHGDNVRIVVRLTAGGADKAGELSADQYLIRYWMAHVKDSEHEQVDTLELLTIWYQSMDLKRFSRIYRDDKSIPMDRVNTFISENAEWIVNNPILETPTFIINDNKIPRAYRLQELTSAFSLILTEMQEDPALDQVEV